MPVILLILERIARHTLPLKNVFLEKDLILESRLTIDDCHHQKDENGDNVRKSSFY